MTRPMLGIIGKKRAGKDTLGQILIYDHGFARYAFADPLKRAALRADPIVTAGLGPLEPSVRLSDMVRAYGWERAKQEPEVRRTLQEYGMAIRDLDEGFWLRQVMTRAAHETRPVVITDVRFPNEAHAIRAAGGLLVRIAGARQDTTDTHPSETTLDHWPTDLFVPNFGDLGDLRAEAAHLVTRLTS